MAASESRPLNLFGRIALLAVLAVCAVPASADLFTALYFVSYCAAGFLLIARRPRNAVGWLVLAVGLAFIGTTTQPGIDVEAISAGTATLRDFLWAWVGTWAGGMSFVLYAALALTFPSGALPGGRWRRPTIAALVIGCVVVILPAFAPSFPFSPDGGVTEILVPNRFALIASFPAGTVPATMVIATGVPILILGVAVVSTIVRYRRSTGIERLQLRWLIASVAFVVAAVVFGLVTYLLAGAELGIVGWLPALVAYPTVPIAIVVAVMRYRLFEIDRIISRTIAWAGVSVMLFAVFAGVTLTLQGALGQVVGNNAITVAVSTLAAAALFNPLRVRTQRVVDRRFNRSRYDQERALAAFAAGLRDEVDVDRLNAHVRVVVQRALEPRALAMWLRPGSEPRA